MWQPTADFATLRRRAAILQSVREFFTTRGVLEVETPLLSHTTVTDPHLHSFATQYQHADHAKSDTLYLQTSPEFAMKRLLAADSGPLFQICKAFRNHGESGRYHNPEFTLLEWYRPGFNHHDLMDEMDDLLQAILSTAPAKRISYAELFMQAIAIDPHHASAAQLKTRAQELGLSAITSIQTDNRDTWLQLIMSHYIEPQFPASQVTFIYDFPVTQAALAQIRAGDPAVAERFEVYVGAIELANGFHELCDRVEQQQRFTNDLHQRRALGYTDVPIDHNLLDALQSGLPNCAGVALGIDRLIMLATEKNSIADVISFPVARA